jgi:hypothetical protein
MLAASDDVSKALAERENFWINLVVCDAI